MDLTRKRLERAKDTLVPQTHSLDGGIITQRPRRELYGQGRLFHTFSGWVFHRENARTYNRTVPIMGTTISSESAPGIPAFLNICQKGITNSTAVTVARMMR
jgi:hypothetical protein